MAMSTLTLLAPPSILVSDASDYDADYDAEEFRIDEDLSSIYERHHLEISKQMFFVLLEDWMYGYGDIYTANHYAPLFMRILELVSEGKIIDFLLPGFPVKSQNSTRKVLGSDADYGEFLVLRSFAATARKLKQIYKDGILITIMSDYHTFDQYIGVSEEAYNIYHAELKQMIFDMGADDVINLIDLSSFPEFQDTMTSQLSSRLGQEYGSKEFLEHFDENIKEDSDLLEKYKQMKKFMQIDQETRLPGSPRSRKTRKFLKDVATGMMSQGLALDAFLKEQQTLGDYVRISIHHHHPKKGKFPVDLFKQHMATDGILRTPWHHTVLFDTMKEEFVVDHKNTLLGDITENSFVSTVIHNEKEWFLLRLFMDASKRLVLTEEDIKVTMIRDGCAIMIENVSTNRDIKSDVFDVTSIRSMIKHYGVLILRGFAHFKNEEELYDAYYLHGDNGIVTWDFGPVHRVKPNKEMPGYVNTKEALPIHWDLLLPPRYMGISQSYYDYEDYTCREFLLYCHRNSKDGTSGATTFIDTSALVLSLPGEVKEQWKNIVTVCESRLLKSDVKKDEENENQNENENENESENENQNENESGIQNENENKAGTLYYGGEDNTFEYPLVMRCPWTNKDVLRWLQVWTEEEHPGTVQEQGYKIKSKGPHDAISVRDLEDEIVKIAFDERFFFGHTYEEGDQVHVNNYTMLHGRNSFTNERELWRLQLIPPSDHVPEYFKTHGHGYFAHGEGK